MSTLEYERFSPSRVRFVKRWTPRLVAFGELIDGYDLLVMGAAILFLRPYFHLDAGQTGALTAIAFVGTAVGLVLFGHVTDRFGRRPIFMINLVFFVVASIATIFVTDLWQLYVARFVLGVAVGMDIPVSHAFLAEISPNVRRGRIAGSLPNIMWLCGAIASVILALIIGPLAGPETWRWLFGLAAIPAAGVLVMRRFLPESPRWLLEHGREPEAMQVFTMLDLDPQPAIDAMRAQQATKEREPVRIRGPILKRLIAVTAFFALQAFAGAVATVSGPLVLTAVGWPKEWAMQWSLIGFVLGLVAVLIGAMIIDNVDRRKLGVVTTTVLFFIGLAIAVFGPHWSWALVALYFLFSFTTWFGPGVLSWIWSAEAFPTEVRGLGTGITQAVTRLMIALNVFLVPTLMSAIGLWTIALYSVAYLICAGICLANPWLATTGKNLEDA